YELVVYILAALELCKSGQLKIYQETLNGPLWLYRSDLNATQLPLQWDSQELRLLEDPASV
ncbi:MAG: hypothetical protein NTX25_05495, partial [Proteobacteria bacterium]|nr:hypothetical protein [Pseudomonadota bacterium]